MKIRPALSAIVLLAVLLAAVGARNSTAGDEKPPHYKVVDLGGFRGRSEEAPKVQDLLNKMKAEGYELHGFVPLAPWVVFQRRP